MDTPYRFCSVPNSWGIENCFSGGTENNSGCILQGKIIATSQ
jgi:hypothetical protein